LQSPKVIPLHEFQKARHHSSINDLLNWWVFNMQQTVELRRGLGLIGGVVSRDALDQGGHGLHSKGEKVVVADRCSIFFHRTSHHDDATRSIFLRLFCCS